jgi:hypothetical protein
MAGLLLTSDSLKKAMSDKLNGLAIGKQQGIATSWRTKALNARTRHAIVKKDQSRRTQAKQRALNPELPWNPQNPYDHQASTLECDMRSESLDSHSTEGFETSSQDQIPMESPGQMPSSDNTLRDQNIDQPTVNPILSSTTPRAEPEHMPEIRRGSAKDIPAFLRRRLPVRTSSTPAPFPKSREEFMATFRSYETQASSSAQGSRIDQYNQTRITSSTKQQSQRKLSSSSSSSSSSDIQFLCEFKKSPSLIVRPLKAIRL